MPLRPELPGAPPLDHRRGFVPRTHAMLCYALPDRKYFSLPPPTLKNVQRGLHVREGWCGFFVCPPPPLPQCLLITPLLFTITYHYLARIFTNLTPLLPRLWEGTEIPTNIAPPRLQHPGFAPVPRLVLTTCTPVNNKSVHR